MIFMFVFFQNDILVQTNDKSLFTVLFVDSSFIYHNFIFSSLLTAILCYYCRQIQIRRRHAARIYAIDLFTAEVGGRLQPSWAEQLLTRLCSLLDYLQRLAWAGVFSGKHWHPTSVEKMRVPDWLLLELRIQLSTACGSASRVASVTQSGWARLSALGNDTSSTGGQGARTPSSQAHRRTVSVSSTSSSSSSSSSSESEKEDRNKKPVRTARKQLGGRDAVKTKAEISSESGSKLTREKLGSVAYTSTTKRTLPTDTKRSVHRSSLRHTPAFSEVIQIAAETARREADRDPWFMRTHRQLLKAVDDWENRSILVCSGHRCLVFSVLIYRFGFLFIASGGTEHVTNVDVSSM